VGKKLLPSFPGVFGSPAVCIFILILAVACVRAASAATYYVATSGADTNAGKKEKPFRTIQKAADVAVAGDTVFVGAGIYRESVHIRNSGTPGKPIVFEGERGPNGEWKTILDPSRPVTDWVRAPEIGQGVYKTTALGFNPYSMTVDNKQILRIGDAYMQLKRGFELLGQAAGSRISTPFGGINYWDGIEALYGYRQGTTYIRFRNGDNPVRKTLKAAPNGDVIMIADKSFIVVRDFHIRGAYRGVVIEGRDAKNDIVEKNFLENGYARVCIQEGAAQNSVADNEMTMDYYGDSDLGPWSIDGLNRRAAIRWHIYSEFRKTFGPNPPGDYGVFVSGSGDGNEIRGNHIFSGLVGICCSVTRMVNVHDNFIHNMSNVGILTINGVVDGEFHDNLVSDCNTNFRIHHYNTPKDNERREYYYRNFSYEPEGMGNHILVHYLVGGWPPDTNHPQIFIYQNSFSGGLDAIHPSSLAARSGGMARTRILNNIFSSPVFCRLCGKAFDSASRMVDIFDYNWVGGSHPEEIPAWFGGHIIRAEGQRLWPWGNMPDFRLATDSPVRGKGIDLSRPFSLNDETFGPLPGMEAGYFTGAAPDLGALQFGEKTPLIFRDAVSELRDQGHSDLTAPGQWKWESRQHI
jgi:Pel9A-like, right handed beta helix region